MSEDLVAKIKHATKLDLEKLDGSDVDEEIEYVEKRLGKKLVYSNSASTIMPRGNISLA
jgi:hypothetical protein